MSKKTNRLNWEFWVIIPSVLVLFIGAWNLGSKEAGITATSALILLSSIFIRKFFLSKKHVLRLLSIGISAIAYLTSIIMFFIFAEKIPTIGALGFLITIASGLLAEDLNAGFTRSSKQAKAPKKIRHRLCVSLLGYTSIAIFIACFSKTPFLATVGWLLVFESLYFIGITIHCFVKGNASFSKKIYGIVGMGICLALLLVLFKEAPVNPLFDFLPLQNKGSVVPDFLTL